MVNQNCTRARALILVTSAAVAGMTGTTTVANAQEKVATEDEPIETMIVTGSNIRRTDEGALPVQVVTHEQIERTGANTVEQLLKSVTAATQGNNNVVAASAAGSNTSGVSGVSLRGLGSQRTLVLINGRRSSPGGGLTDSTTVDINSIPLSAVERVEVLKDGASAVYGSDAIAGVVNFILRKDYSGADLTVNYGDTADGGAQSQRATATFGFGNIASDRFNVLFVANYQKEKSLFGYQRKFANSGINVDAENDTTSGNAFPANIAIPVLDENGDPATATVNPNYPNCAPAVVDPLFGGAPVCRYDPSPLVNLLPASERSSIYGAAHFTLTSNVEGYAEASFSRNRQNTIIQGSPVSDQFAIPPTHPLANIFPYNASPATTPGVAFATILLRPSSQFYPTAAVQSVTGGATPDVFVRYRTVSIGNRDFTDIADVSRGVLGVQGTAAGWEFNVPFLYAKTHLTERINAGIELYTRLLPLLNSGTVNFFGPNTPAIQAQLDATQFIGDAYKTNTSIMSLAPTVSRELMQLPAGPLAIALGAEGRKEKFETEVAPELQIGDTTQYGGSNLPTDRSRNVTSLFAELNIPIVKNLSSDLAVRYDDYQGTGSKTTPKVGVRWQPLTQLLLRASYGKGFRAPSLSELYQPQITGVSAPGLNDPVRCGPGSPNDSRDCLTQFNILLGGNPGLQPEESDNYTLGAVFDPGGGISLGLDGFKIKLTNTIIFGIDPTEILANAGQFASFISREAPSSGLPGHILQINQTNLNFGETRIQGVDVNAQWKLPQTPAGQFTFTLDGTYVDYYKIQNLLGEFSNIAGQVSPLVNGAGGAVPRWHHYLSVDWSLQSFNLTLAQNYQHGYQDVIGAAQDPDAPGFSLRRVHAYTTYDMQASYSGFGNLKPSVGIKNITNQDPPYTNVGGSSFFQAGYDPGYADPRGRFFYGTVTYSFK